MTVIVKNRDRCKHVFTGYESGTPYFSVAIRGAIDGIGREHCYIYGTCDKCNKKVAVGMFHKPEEFKNEN